MIVQVKPDRILSTGLSSDPCLLRPRTLRLDKVPIGAGGQGRVWRVLEIDSKSPREQYLLKTFEYGVPSTFEEILSALSAAGFPSGVAGVTSLNCLPLTRLSGTAAGRPIEGYLMRYASGVSLSDLLDTRLREYINQPIENRLALARQFAAGVAKLHSATIILADVNGQNLLVDMAQPRLSIIDIDGGAVARNGSAPAVFGKLDAAWLAPELLPQLLAVSAPKVNVHLTADLYAVAAGIHILIFGLSPFFFLEKMSDIARYLSQCPWGSLRPATGVPFRNRQAFAYYRRTLAEVPGLQKLFTASFQKGHSMPLHRLPAYVWLQALNGELERRNRHEKWTRSQSTRSQTVLADRWRNGGSEDESQSASSVVVPRQTSNGHAPVIRLVPAWQSSLSSLGRMSAMKMNIISRHRLAGILLVLLVAVAVYAHLRRENVPEPIGTLTTNRAALVNIRSKPSLDSKVKSIIEVRPGDRLALIEARGRWSRIHVNLGDKSAVGWVYDAGDVSPRVELQSAGSR